MLAYSLAHRQTERAAQPSLIHLPEDFCGSVPIAISLPPSPVHSGCFFAYSEILYIFFFQFLHFNYAYPFRKAACFEIRECLHRSCCFPFLWIPLLTEAYWFPEGNCLDFFIASICPHWSHWQTFCLFFSDRKLSQMPSGSDQHIYWTVSKTWGA